MLKVTLFNKETMEPPDHYGVSWHHLQDKDVRYTSCNIVWLEEGKPFAECTIVGVGHAQCHVKDKFVKETGRKISLARALEEGGFDKDEREVFWNYYHARTIKFEDTITGCTVCDGTGKRSK